MSRLDQNSPPQRFVVVALALLISGAALSAMVYFLIAGDGLSRLDRQLFTAIDQGDYRAVEAALAEGADPNAKDVARTPLMAATANGHLSVVELLLKHPDIQVNQSAYGGFTAMDAALQCVIETEGQTRNVKIAQPEIAKLLRSHNARTLAELKYDAPSERWLNNWPETIITGTVVAVHEDHIELQDDSGLHPVMGETIPQIQLDDLVVVRGHPYHASPIGKAGTIWADSIERSE